MSANEPRAANRSTFGALTYIGLVCLLALAVIVVGWVLDGPPSDPVALVILTLMGMASWILREPDVGSRVGFSFLSIVLLAGIVIVGPVGCAVIGALSMGLELGRQQARVRVFNAGMTAFWAGLGGLVYEAVGGERNLSILDGPGQLLLHVGAPLMVADVAQMLANAALLSGIVRIDRRVPFRRFFIQMVTNSGVAYLGYGFIGFLFVILWIPADVGPFSAVLILAPLFVARWAFVQFGEEQRAHESALSALVTAVETKDPYAVGHSARIADLAGWIAEPLSLSTQEVQSLRFAAMLHDVGKVGVPTRIVRRPGAMTSEDLNLLSVHPNRGVELLRDIDFLGDSLDGIRHHHERFDGRGYPDRLVAEEIPLSARIISVADAFDSLTQPRPHRSAFSISAAVAELQLRSGSQFDPSVVTALRRALERYDWRGVDIDVDTQLAMTDYFDHDDPAASDLAADTLSAPGAPRR